MEQCPRCKKDVPGFVKMVTKKSKKNIVICVKAKGGCGYWREDKDGTKQGQQKQAKEPEGKQTPTTPPAPATPPAREPAGETTPWYDRDLGDLIGITGDKK